MCPEWNVTFFECSACVYRCDTSDGASFFLFCLSPLLYTERERESACFFLPFFDDDIVLWLLSARCVLFFFFHSMSWRKNGIRGRAGLRGMSRGKCKRESQVAAEGGAGKNYLPRFILGFCIKLVAPPGGSFFSPVVNFCGDFRGFRIMDYIRIIAAVWLKWLILIFCALNVYVGI